MTFLTDEKKSAGKYLFIKDQRAVSKKGSYLSLAGLETELEGLFNILI